MPTDSYSKGLMIALGITFLIFPCIFVGLRFWAKWHQRRSLQWDDFLIFLALTFSIACSITQLIGAIDGQLGQHQRTDENNQPILDDPRFLIYEKCKFASQMLAVIGLGLTKASILILIRGIFSVSRPFRHLCNAMLFVVAAWTISFFFSNLFTCFPITPLVEPFYGNKCINGLAMWYAGCISDVVVDMIILIIPLPMISQLKLPLRQKVGIGAIFLLGTTVVVISITRMAMYFHVGTTFREHYNDMTYYTSPVFFWTNIEISLAVILACLPTLRPVWTVLSGGRARKSSMYRPYGEIEPENSERMRRAKPTLDTIDRLESSIALVKVPAGPR